MVLDLAALVALHLVAGVLAVLIAAQTELLAPQTLEVEVEVEEQLAVMVDQEW